MAESLVLRRALDQWPVLLTVLALTVAGATVLGVGTLLLTTGGQHALASAASTATDREVAVSASLVLTPPRPDRPQDPAATVAAATDLLTGALEPFGSEVSTWAASAMRYLPPGPDGSPRLAYLLDADTLPEHAALDAGRWPTPGVTTEVAVPSTTADLLGLTTGSRLVLADAPQHDDPDAAPGPDAASEPAPDPAPGPEGSVVVVGTFTPRWDDAATWQRDPLDGAGHDPSWDRLGAYGPFVVAPGTLLAGGVPLERVSLVVLPDLSAPIPPPTTPAAALDRVAAAVRAGGTAVEDSLGERVSAVVVRSALPRTLATARTAQGLTGSAVLVVVLVGWTLAGTSVGLAGRLLHGRRSTEVTLLTARGADRGRLVRQAAAEALALAVAATALAVPLSIALYRGLTALPLLTAAGLGGPAPLTSAVLVTVAAGALTLVAVLVAPSLRGSSDAHGGSDRPARRGVLARSGADLILAAVGVLAYLQLRAHRGATGPDPDPVLVLAPVACLLAGAVLMLRVLPWLAALGEVWARRSTRLTVPLAAWETARRPQATAGAFLLVLATATATFGLSWTSTWLTSQQDQADAQVGADLSVDLTGTAPLSQGPVLAAATGGTAVAVVDRPVALGSRTGAGSAGSTRLLAVDTVRAADLMRGRLPADTSWAALSAGLAPGQAGSGPVLGPAPTVWFGVSGSATDRATGPGEPLVRVVPTLVVTDSHGSRAAVTGPPVPLDGRTHQVDLPMTPDARTVPAELTLVALELRVVLDPAAAVDPEVERIAAIDLRLELPDRSPATDRTWTATPVAGPGARLSGVRAGPSDPGTGPEGPTGVTVSAEVSLVDLLYGDARAVLTPFTSPPDLPVTVTADLADTLALSAGDPLTVNLGPTAVEARVVGVAPYLPSVPRGPAVLADREALSRMVLVQGDLDPLTDRWWSSAADSPSAAAALARLTHAEPATRQALTTQLQDGALHVGLRAALWVMIGAALVLALAGTAVHTAAVQEGRAVEVARLQGLGVPRGAVLRALVLQHGAVTVVAVAAGAALGALLAWAVGPLLVVSAGGLPPVPPASAQWPWAPEGVVVAGLVLGCAAVALPVLATLVRRATVAHLRMDAP